MEYHEMKLIAMMGLPRSGKSTLCKALSTYLGAPIVNRDSIRLALHGQRFVALAEPMVKTVSQLMMRSLFLAGHETVLCDETNISRAARDFLKDPSWTTVFYEVPTSADICIARAITTGQPDLIDVITRMWARYESLGEDEARYTCLEADGSCHT